MVNDPTETRNESHPILSLWVRYCYLSNAW